MVTTADDEHTAPLMDGRDNKVFHGTGYNTIYLHLHSEPMRELIVCLRHQHQQRLAMQPGRRPPGSDQGHAAHRYPLTRYQNPPHSRPPGKGLFKGEENGSCLGTLVERTTRFVDWLGWTMPAPLCRRQTLRCSQSSACRLAQVNDVRSGARNA